MTNKITIRFAGDSGDGIQLLGQSFVNAIAQKGSNLTTFPSYPAEIRAPQGTLFGVSGFQIQFSGHKVLTPGDKPDLLIALNPAALKTNVDDLKKGGVIIINESAFSELALKKAGYDKNPLLDDSLSDYRLICVNISGILRIALKDLGLSTKDLQRCKNFFCLGLMHWLYSLDKDKDIEFISEKFKHKPKLKEANIIALNAGYAYGENTEALAPMNIINGEPDHKAGLYRTLSGNKALALGLLTAAKKADLDLFYASYPITPASDILHELSNMRRFGGHTYQLEDEMAAICAAIGASYAGSLGVTATSGPGFALKAEALGYACMIELPLLVIDVQRAGPATGMPTKTEQSDLMMAIYGRSGEARVPVIALKDASHAFDAAIKATRIAIKFMTPVIILSDAYVANSQSPWRIKKIEDIEPIKIKNEPHSLPYLPYERDNETLSRAWITPPMKETIAQIGGLEKNEKGNVSYDPLNHHQMTTLRRKKIERVKNYYEAPLVYGESTGDILLISFGGTYGAIRQATIDLIKARNKVSHLHLELIYPLHDEIKDILDSFKKTIVIEQNLGQLKELLAAHFNKPLHAFNQVYGKPFLVDDIKKEVNKYLSGQVS